VTGNALRLNAQVSGSLRVEILDSQGQVLPGYAQSDSDPLNGDQVDQLASWHGQAALGALLGQTVTLRFYLDGGDLYAYRFGNNP